MSHRSIERAPSRHRAVATAVGLATGFGLLGAVPLAAGAGVLPGSAGQDHELLRTAVDAVERTVDRAVAAVPLKPAPVKPVAAPEVSAPPAPVARVAPAATARQEDPQTQPPLHGTNPHGQGTVASVDLTPSTDRPTGGDPSGSDAGEEVVLGRARAEQQVDGTYRGHITILALFGNELLGVNTTPGQTAAGPLDPVQQGVLNPLCTGSGDQICASAVRADSATTPNGSANRFSAASATLGGPGGVSVGAAESTGTASSDGRCQTTHGDSRVADVTAGGGAVASVAQSSTDSRACKGQAPEQTNRSSVIGLGGVAVPLPAAGCGEGTPDTVTGIPTLLPIVCNGDDTNGQAPAPAGVREALTIFTLATGTSAAVKTTTAASESVAKAPPTQCADGIDNDGDGLADGADGGCHTDGNPNNSASFDPADDDESGGQAPTPATSGQGAPAEGPGSSGDGGRPACSDGRDNDGDGRIDSRDPGCHTDGNPNNPASFDPDDTTEGGGGGGAGGGGDPAQCADGRDNDGDGRTDAGDPGCHTDGDAGNPASYVATDDSEADARAAGAGLGGPLPRTGAELLGLALASILLIAAGALLRRRHDGA